MLTALAEVCECGKRLALELAALVGVLDHPLAFLLGNAALLGPEHRLAGCSRATCACPKGACVAIASLPVTGCCLVLDRGVSGVGLLIGPVPVSTDIGGFRGLHKAIGVCCRTGAGRCSCRLPEIGGVLPRRSVLRSIGLAFGCRLTGRTEGT